MTGALVFPEVMVGIAEASTTRRPATRYTRQSVSSTVAADRGRPWVSVDDRSGAGRRRAWRFLDFAAKQVHPDWDEATALAVGGLRALFAEDPDDARLRPLIETYPVAMSDSPSSGNRPRWGTPKGLPTCVIQRSAIYT